MKNKKGLLIIAVIVAGCFVFFSCAGAMHGHGTNLADMHEHFLLKAKQELKLTDQQLEAVRKIGTEVMQKAHELNKNNEALHQEIKALMASDYVRESDILLIMDKIEQAHAEFKPFIAAKLAELHNLLTPEQREKIGKHLEMFAQKMHN